MHRKTHWLRGNAQQADERRPESELGQSGRMASVDVTDARRDTALGYDSGFTFWSPDTLKCSFGRSYTKRL